MCGSRFEKRLLEFLGSSWSIYCTYWLCIWGWRYTVLADYALTTTGYGHWFQERSHGSVVVHAACVVVDAGTSRNAKLLDGHTHDSNFSSKKSVGLQHSRFSRVGPMEINPLHQRRTLVLQFTQSRSSDRSDAVSIIASLRLQSVKSAAEETGSWKCTSAFHIIAGQSR